MRWTADTDEPAGTERIAPDRHGKAMRSGQRWRQCSSKSRYPSEYDAERYARRMEREHGAKLRAYPCGICGGFHLTTKADNGGRR